MRLSICERILTVPSDEAKQLRREQLEKDMAKRDEYDPEKKKERERAEKEAELQAKYWLANPQSKCNDWWW